MRFITTIRIRRCFTLFPTTSATAATAVSCKYSPLISPRSSTLFLVLHRQQHHSYHYHHYHYWNNQSPYFHSNRLSLFMEMNSFPTSRGGGGGGGGRGSSSNSGGRRSTGSNSRGTTGSSPGRGYASRGSGTNAGRGTSSGRGYRYHTASSTNITSTNTSGSATRGRMHLPHNSTTTAANAAMDAMYQQQPIRTVTTATATATATTAKKNKAAPKKKAANASPKRSKSPNGKNASKLLRNGEKGAEVHTVEEEYRIRLTRSIMQFRESDTVTTLQFPPTLTNTERKFVHELAQRFGLTSKSKGKGENRSITVTKPEPKIKTTKLNEDNLPELSLGPWGKDALHRFVTNYPPSPDEELESHETGKSLIQALGRGDTDDVILTRLNDLGLTDSFMMDGVNDHKRRRNKFNRPVDLLRRQEYHNKAQRRKQTHPNFTKMLNQRLKLPAYRHYDTVVQKVAQNAVTIISGETGCGKSTQIPQFILDANPTCKMVVTQPRRISAISIAERVAEEQCQDGVGGIVGYQVRLESSFTNDTQCIFMTPGILLNKMHSILDPNYTEYTHIIIDEIHERVREQEFLLIILRDLLPKRPDLRVVLMSATLQTNELVDYFRRGGIEPAVVEMEGRTFPVQEYFLEQVLEMTGFIDPSSKYDVGSKLESAMAELIGSKLVNNEVANVSLECAMCGKKGFTDPLALGEHIASCDGGLSFSTNSDDDASTRSAAKPVNVMDTAYENYINNFGEFDLSDVQSDSDLSDTSIGESDATKGGAKTFPTKEAIADVRNALKRQGSSKSQDDAQKPAKTTLHFNELIAAAPVTSNIELTPNEKALLTKYHLKQNDEDIDFTLILELVRYISRLSYGDGGILIFLPGWFEISYLSQLLESSAPFSDRNRFLVLPLHSGIASKDQRRVMQPPPIGVRKIVLSTNIAETSLTINDIVYVIDTGRAKEKNYDPHLKSSTLQPTWISRASAKQRKGRAGRVQPGICFHLFSRTRHESMPPFTESELLRTPLEEMCLISKRLGLAPGGPEDDDGVPAFLAKAMSAPHAKSVSNALELLVDLGAMYPETNQLTALGQCLSVLSLEPRVGKMVIWSYVLGCTRVASNMAVAMSFKSPFVLPLESSRRAAQQSLVALSENSESDQITIHKVLETIDTFRSNPGLFYDFCRNNFISANTIQMMADSRVNLAKELASLGFSNPALQNQYHNRHDSDESLWHAAIAAGLYPNMATRKAGEVNFSSMTNQKLKIHPSSVNAAKGQRLSAKCQVSKGEIEFVCFGEMLKGELMSTASQTTRLQSPLPILLLCGTSLRVQPHPTMEGEAILNLDDWVVFKCEAKLASHIVMLRKRLHSAFWTTIKEPSHVPKLSEEESNAVEILGTILRSAQIITTCPI